MPETSRELIATIVGILCGDTPGAAVNAVREDYPETAEIIYGAFAKRDAEIQRLQQQNNSLAIQRDKEFWKEYADDTCRNLHNSNAKLQWALAALQKTHDGTRRKLAKVWIRYNKLHSLIGRLLKLHYDHGAEVWVGTDMATGCVSQGRSKSEAIEAALSAGKLYVEARESQLASLSEQLTASNIEYGAMHETACDNYANAEHFRSCFSQACKELRTKEDEIEAFRRASVELGAQLNEERRKSEEKSDRWAKDGSRIELLEAQLAEMEEQLNFCAACQTSSGFHECPEWRNLKFQHEQQLAEKEQQITDLTAKVESLEGQLRELEQWSRRAIEWDIAGYFGFADWAKGKSASEVAEEIEQRHKETENTLTNLWKERIRSLEEALRSLSKEIKAIAHGQFGSDWADEYGPLYKLVDRAEQLLNPPSGEATQEWVCQPNCAYCNDPDHGHPKPHPGAKLKPSGEATTPFINSAETPFANRSGEATTTKEKA